MRALIQLKNKVINMNDKRNNELDELGYQKFENNVQFCLLILSFSINVFLLSKVIG